MGAPAEISRGHVGAKAVVVGTALGNADEIDVSGFAGGGMQIPAGSTLTTVTVYFATQIGGPYSICGDSDNPVAVVADSYRSLPAGIFGAAGMKLIGNLAGTVNLLLKG